MQPGEGEYCLGHARRGGVMRGLCGENGEGKPGRGAVHAPGWRFREINSAMEGDRLQTRCCVFA